MPNPKRKHTRSRRDSRRSQNWKIRPAAISICSNPKCGLSVRPHTVCAECGFYKGKLVIARKVKKKDKGETPESGK